MRGMVVQLGVVRVGMCLGVGHEHPCPVRRVARFVVMIDE
jgi:hypothetical protein